MGIYVCCVSLILFWMVVEVNVFVWHKIVYNVTLKMALLVRFVYRITFLIQKQINVSVILKIA